MTEEMKPVRIVQQFAPNSSVLEARANVTER